MRRGSKTSTGSKGNTNDASKKSAKSNSTADKTSASKKHGKEKNKDIVDIQPLVYSFRVPSNPSPGCVMNALLPPYWLYHDHAFGVIWMLFHADKKYIGIAQLHWCLRFLLDLKNTEGEYTGDVNVCIQAVQDDLIEQYAKLGTALEQQEPQDGKSEDPNSENDKSGQTSSSNKKVKESSKEDAEENDVASPSLKPQESNMSELSACSSVNENEYINAQSLTYNEMISRGPTPYTEQTPLEQIYKAGTDVGEVLPTSTPDIAAMLTADSSPPDIPLAEMGTEELVNFLNSSRNEQVERIKKEIDRLHELEKFMEGIDKQGFKAYVTDDLARRLDRVDGQGVSGNDTTMYR